jgi:hypothetical protein
MSNWISVDCDIKPRQMAPIIISDGLNVGCGYFAMCEDESSWQADGYNCYLFDRTEITHWQLLPAPPSTAK